MKGHLLHLFDYTTWAHELIAESLTNSMPDDARAVSLFAHIVATEEIWLARLEGRPQATPIWPERNLERCKADMTKTVSAWKRFLDAREESDLNQPIDYATSQGEPFKNSVKEVVTHVVNHGTHHRAQIVSRLREAGHVPPATDYIFYIRAHPKYV